MPNDHIVAILQKNNPGKWFCLKCLKMCNRGILCDKCGHVYCYKCGAKKCISQKCHTKLSDYL